MSKYYAGIGARSTPQDFLNAMTIYATRLEKLGFILRSGGAQGADKAFEHGVTKGIHKQIFHPNCHPSDAALEIASKIHPAWDKCSEYARWCHGRNVYQVLGEDLQTPVEFVICWTPGSEPVGGTRTAIMLARQRGIMLFNLANPGHERLLRQCVGNLEKEI